MNAAGISAELQTAILLPEFEDIRYSASCEFWILDAMRMRYGSLEVLDQRLRIEAGRIEYSRQTASYVQEVPESTVPILGPPTSEEEVGHDPSPESHSPKTTTTHSSLDQGKEQVAPAVAMSTAPSLQDGHTMLWRSQDRVRAEAFYDERTEEFDFNKISSAPGDSVA